jgi:hypothetical protein
MHAHVSTSGTEVDARLDRQSRHLTARSTRSRQAKVWKLERGKDRDFERSRRAPPSRDGGECPCNWSRRSAPSAPSEIIPLLPSLSPPLSSTLLPSLFLPSLPLTLSSHPFLALSLLSSSSSDNPHLFFSTRTHALEQAQTQIPRHSCMCTCTHALSLTHSLTHSHTHAHTNKYTCAQICTNIQTCMKWKLRIN